MRTASILGPACHYHNRRRTCCHDITRMPATKIEVTRLKINALEMLRPLGITAITVIPLAKCSLSHIITIITIKKSYRTYRSSSTATSPHGVAIEHSYIICSPAGRLSRIRLGESNVGEETQRDSGCSWIQSDP